VSYEVLCPECLKCREGEGTVLFGEDEVNEYLGLTAPLHPEPLNVEPVMDADADGAPVVDLLREGEFMVRMDVDGAKAMAQRIMDITK
jgi:hypothetical protein